MHANSIIFEKADLMGILKRFCRRFAGAGVVSIIDVSNDGEISYVLHMYEFIYSLCGLNLLDGHSGGHSTVTTPSTTGMHITL